MTRRLVYVNIGALVVAGVVARVYAIDRLPGLNGDEAWCAYQSFQFARRGDWHWRTPSGLPLEPYFTLVQAAVFQLAAPSTWAARLPSVLAGALLAPVSYLALSRIAGMRSACACTIVIYTLPVGIAYARFGWYPSQSVIVSLVAVACALGNRPWIAALSFLSAIIVHPTNVFLLPILIMPWITPWLVRRGIDRSVIMWTGGLAAAGILSLCIAINFFPYRLPTFLVPPQGRLADYAAWSEFAVWLIRLFSGTTTYRYICGSGYGRLATLQDGATAFALLALIAWNIGRFAIRTDPRFAGLWTGLVFAAVLYFVVAGPRGTESHFERYGFFLIAPAIVCIGRAIEPSLNKPAVARRVLWAVSLVGWLYLTGFAWQYFAFMHRTGGQSHRAFRTGPVDPKQAAAIIILEDLAGRDGSSVATVVAEDWWLYWPIKYLTAGRPVVNVQPYEGPQRTIAVLQNGGFVVVYDDVYTDHEISRHLSDRPIRRWTVPDWSGRPWLAVIRLE
jgi:hypothetical protein